MKNEKFWNDFFMLKAIAQANIAKKQDEVPIGCVIALDNKVIARAHNTREKSQNAINHAEILAISRACKKLGTFRLEDCTLYVTCEPCAMCCGAIIQARIARVVYGVSEPKFGCVESKGKLLEQGLFNHNCEVTSGVLQEECAVLLKEFFRGKRKKVDKNL